MRINTNGKIIIAVVAAVLACLLLVALLGNAFGLFAKDLKDVSLRERNEKNYLKTWELKSQNTGDGVDVTVKDNGSVKLSGKNAGGSDMKYTYAKVSLSAGEYTLWGNPNGAQKNTYYIIAEWDGGSAYADFDGSNKITLTGNTEVTISIVVCGEESVNATFYPVLCSGTEEVSFYA